MESFRIDLARARRLLCYLGAHGPVSTSPLAGGVKLEVATCATCGTRRVRPSQAPGSGVSPGGR